MASNGWMAHSHGRAGTAAPLSFGTTSIARRHRFNSGWIPDGRIVNEGSPGGLMPRKPTGAKIMNAETLSEDHGDGKFVVDEAKLQSHLESPPKRWAKMLMHSFGLWP